MGCGTLLGGGMSQRRKKNLLAFNPGKDIQSLGKLVAEEDQYLREYYVDPERYVTRADNVDDPAVFFVGPKGSGKSAILQMVRLMHAAESAHLINLSPDDLAFSALTNVQATTPLVQDTDRYKWTFKSLWDYVLTL